jgi:hypothetical protein
MPTISKPILADIESIAGSQNSRITVTYTVTFDVYDQAVKTPYLQGAYVWGDDTNVIGDAAGGADDLLTSRNLAIIYPEPPVQTMTQKVVVPTATLNEDSSGEPSNSNPDEIRVRIGLKPLLAYNVMSEESNVRTISVV